MKSKMALLGMMGLFMAISALISGQDIGIAYGPHAEGSASGNEGIHQNVSSEFVKSDNQKWDERMAKTLNNVFAISFAHEMAEFSLERKRDNAKLTALKLLEVRFRLESIQHAMQEDDIRTVGKELEKPFEKIDVDLIVNTVSKAYPKVRDYYDEELSVKTVSLHRE